MKWRLCVPALVLAFAGTRAGGQQARLYPLVGEATLSADGRTLSSAGRASEDVRERYEEIEIMARLLDRSIDRLGGIGFHDSVLSLAFSPDGKTLTAQSDGTVRLWDAHTGQRIASHAGADLTGMQGVYLKGQGVVFTMTVPQHFQRPVGGPDKPAQKQLTEWERIRKELRGEKVEPVKHEDATQSSIADAVLKVLADNGKNLTRLPAEENVTVAITLLRVPACISCHANVGGAGASGGPMGPGMGHGMMPGAPGMGRPGLGGSGPGGMPGVPGAGSSGGSGGGPGLGGAGPGEASGALADFRKYALMGDLALKQSDFPQAVEQYRKAAGVRIAPGDPAIALEYLEVATRLARALMAQGKTAEADKAVQSLRNLADSLKDRQNPEKPAQTKPDVALPAKLMITVPKKLLDLVGGGKVSFDEFRKGASVEYLTFDKQ